MRNPGDPASGLVNNRQVRTVNLRDTTVMHGCRESDSSIVPRKPANKGCPKEPAEEVEGRELAKGNVASKPGAGHSAGASCHMRSAAYVW